VHGIDRFSEDLDFDNKKLSKEVFIKMTDDIVRFLKNSGFPAETEDKPKEEKLKAFRRNITFPSFLYDNGLSPFKDEKFLVKIESQDQGYIYPPLLKTIKGTGQLFNFPVAPDDILCSMKISALLDRKKGRDFYDAMFLLSKTLPNYGFLKHRTGISNFIELKHALLNMLDSVNLSIKSKDFEHLLFNKENAKKILMFKDFINQLPS
jgi:predicted nucleotidyltransferase component of viral defense system